MAIPTDLDLVDQMLSGARDRIVSGWNPGPGEREGTWCLGHAIGDFDNPLGFKEFGDYRMESGGFLSTVLPGPLEDMVERGLGYLLDIEERYEPEPSWLTVASCSA